MYSFNIHINCECISLFNYLKVLNNCLCTVFTVSIYNTFLCNNWYTFILRLVDRVQQIKHKKRFYSWHSKNAFLYLKVSVQILEINLMFPSPSGRNLVVSFGSQIGHIKTRKPGCQRKKKKKADVKSRREGK